MTPTVERRKTDLLDDPIDEDILREIREATDEAEKRRLMIDYQINRQLWRLGSLVADISAKISRQDELFEQHRVEIKTILDTAHTEYQAHRKEFMQHARDEELLISNGQTAYKLTQKMVAGVATIILGLCYYIFNIHVGELRQAQESSASHEKALVGVQQRIQLLDDAFSRHIIAGRDPQPAATMQNGIKLPDR